MVTNQDMLKNLPTDLSWETKKNDQFKYIFLVHIIALTIAYNICSNIILIQSNKPARK